MTPLTCDQLNDLLGDILNDEMELHVRAEVEIHLGVCPHCGGLVAACRATITVTRALPKCDPLPADLEARLRKLLKSGQ